MSNKKKEFTINGIDHIAIVPKDLEKAKNFFQLFFSAEPSTEIIEDQNIKAHILPMSDKKTDNTEAKLEILESTDEEKSPIKNFYLKKGGGIHHVAVRVSNIEKAIDFLKDNKMAVINETPSKGAHNTRISFVHPKSTGGILLELVEKKS